MEFYNSSRIRTILKLLCGRAFSIGSVRNTRSLDRVKNSSSPHGCELLSYSAQILQCELRLAPGLKQQVKVTEEHRRCQLSFFSGYCNGPCKEKTQSLSLKGLILVLAMTRLPHSVQNGLRQGSAQAALEACNLDQQFSNFLVSGPLYTLKNY